MEQPRGYVTQGVCKCLQVEEVTLCFETVSESLIWALCISDSRV